MPEKPHQPACAKRGIVRQVPLPRDTLRHLSRFFKLRILQRDPELAVERLWSWSRTTAWRRIKDVMTAAGISGAPAMPRGLRHTFGVNAFQSSIPPHLVQRWMGHASLRTTSIYGDGSACGPRRPGNQLLDFQRNFLLAESYHF
jgi:integrase/recombinase XerD